MDSLANGVPVTGISGTWYVVLRGIDAYADVSLRATYSNTGGSPVGSSNPSAPGAARALGIIATPDRGPAPLDVVLEATGVVPGAACAWDFGDGTARATIVVGRVANRPHSVPVRGRREERWHHPAGGSPARGHARRPQ